MLLRVYGHKSHIFIAISCPTQLQHYGRQISKRPRYNKIGNNENLNIVFLKVTEDKFT